MPLICSSLLRIESPISNLQSTIYNHQYPHSFPRSVSKNEACPRLPIRAFFPGYPEEAKEIPNTELRIPNTDHRITNLPTPDYLIPIYLFPPNPWYTTRRAPLGANVSGNCFDHYRSMPDGNQIGLFCCQTPRFRKEAPLQTGNGISPAQHSRGAGGTESSKRFPSIQTGN